MSSNYTIAFAGMPALLDEQEHVMENFTFERYPDSFKRYCNKHKATLKAVEDGYLQVIDKEQFLTNMAEELANSAEKRIAEEEKKNAKEKLDRWLKDGITTPGGKLPSERELGELLGIKRMTLRQALLNLEAESKIFRKDRKGWFVTQPRFNYSPELSASFQRAAIEQGREPSWGFTEKSRTSDIPETLAPLIAVTPSTELYRITGWGALEGHKVFYHETYINPEVAPGFIEQLENHSFSAVWEKCYQKETVVKKLIFKPVRMPGDISKYLGGSAGMPAILIEKHRADQQGNIVQIDIEYWRFEAVDLIINL